MTVEAAQVPLAAVSTFIRDRLAATRRRDMPCARIPWIAGPTSALITSSGERRRHYTAAMFTGLLAITFGLMAPAFTGLMLAAPKEYVMALGGLAMLRVLQASFVASFIDPALVFLNYAA